MERWQVIIEITFDPKEGEDKHKAVDRVKAVLERMLDNEPEIAHYHLLQLPKKVIEFD